MLNEIEIGKPTRNEAIFHIADVLSWAGLEKCKQLAQVLGAEVAVDVTLFGARLDLLALEALGVTREDITAAVAEQV